MSYHSPYPTLRLDDKVKGDYKGEAFAGVIVEIVQASGPQIVRVKVKFEIPLSFGPYKFFYVRPDGRSSSFSGLLDKLTCVDFDPSRLMSYSNE